MFDIGDEVVCVNDSDPPQGEGPNRVVQGQRYTIKGFRVGFRTIGRMGPIVMAQPELYVFLNEVESPRGVGFYAFRFRKVDKRSENKSTDEGFKILDDIRKSVTDNPVKTPEKVE